MIGSNKSEQKFYISSAKKLIAFDAIRLFLFLGYYYYLKSSAWFTVLKYFCYVHFNTISKTIKNHINFKFSTTKRYIFQSNQYTMTRPFSICKPKHIRPFRHLSSKARSKKKINSIHASFIYSLNEFAKIEMHRNASKLKLALYPLLKSMVAIICFNRIAD